MKILNLKLGKMLSASALVATVLFSGGATAGNSVDNGVYVNTYWKFFGGNLNDARNSSNSVEKIGCSVNGSSSNSYKVSCQATTNSGTSAACYRYNTDHLRQAVQAMTAHSYIQVSYDSSGLCTSITINNNSQYVD